jgi:hypothetical protein
VITARGRVYFQMPDIDLRNSASKIARTLIRGPTGLRWPPKHSS